MNDRPITNAPREDGFPRHRWYSVKEGFSPILVERALEHEGTKPGELLVDPFSGGGTVPLTGSMAGLHVLAFEVNPFLHFISSAKLSSTDGPSLERASEEVLRSMERQVPSTLEGYSTFTEGNRWGRWLFPLSVIRTFEAGKRAVHKTRTHDHNSLLKLALIAAAMDCCNATRDGKCLRFRKGWAQRQATAVQMREKFELRIRQMSTDLEQRPLCNLSARVIEGDARKEIPAHPDKFRICVTSPPYLNSFDYSDVYRPELFLGDFVSSTYQLRTIRLKTIRSHVQASWQKPLKEEFGILYKQCISDLKKVNHTLWDRRLLLMVQAYFEDMERVLRALRLRALENASLWLVVSTSAYGGVEVPVDLILAELGQRTGWSLREIEVLRHLRSSSQHSENSDEKERRAVRLRESLIVFDAVGGNKRLVAKTGTWNHFRRPRQQNYHAVN